MRHLRRTLCFAFVASALAPSGGVVGVGGGQAAIAEDAPPAAAAGTPDAAADLRLVERQSAPVADRLAAAKRVTEAVDAALRARPTDAQRSAAPLLDVDRVLRAATSLVAADPGIAGTLAMGALDAGPARRDARETLAAAATRALDDPSIAADAKRQQDLEAILLLACVRGRATTLLAQQPLSPLAKAAVVRDAPEINLADRGGGVDARPTIDRWNAHEKGAALLDAASEDDPKAAERALDGLVAAGADALPLLVATAKPGATPTPPGLLERRVRAIVALGAIGDRSAVPALVACVDDDITHHEDGWVRVAAIDALADLKDPRALFSLARVLHYPGDIHRPYDNWEHPGALITSVPFDAWAGVENYAIDSAAAAALLSLGVRGAAEWLIEQRLDPRTGRWRIRVTQDAVDAIRKAFPGAPDVYEPDAGFPQRQAGFEALRAWWRTGPRLATPLDENDPAVHAELHAIVERIGGSNKSVNDLQIVKGATALIGAPLTPSILDVLAAAKKPLRRAELAVVLGTVRDRRAIPVLVALTKEAHPTVRANATLSLRAYADPEFPALLDGASEITPDAIVSRWVELLDDAAVRTAAMECLSSVSPRPSVAAALDAHDSRKHPEVPFDESYRVAEKIARLIHEGEDVEGVCAQTDSQDLFRRRSAWEILRLALRLDPRDFDPTPAPDAAGRKPLDRESVSRALAKRREPAR